MLASILGFYRGGYLHKFLAGWIQHGDLRFGLIFVLMFIASVISITPNYPLDKSKPSRFAAAAAKKQVMVQKKAVATIVKKKKIVA